MEQNRFNLVFAVCHPDDEALWVGGLLYEFSKIPFFQVSVVCLSGGETERVPEFEKAKVTAGYANGVVLGEKLLPSGTRLPEPSQTLEEGLKKIHLSPSQVDLLITHSPFGDEHIHYHHQQAHFSLLKWASKKKVPFGAFTCLPMRQFRYRPLLRNLKRHGTLHLLNHFKIISKSFLLNRINFREMKVIKKPKYLLQFLVDSAQKKKILNCYKSIDLKSHENGYASFTSNSESLYLYDQASLKPFNALFSYMDVPGTENLFQDFPSMVKKVPGYLKRKLKIG